MKILVLNPGSTSTKVSVFEDKNEIFKLNVSHDKEKLKTFPHVMDQLEYRKELILKALEEAGLSVGDMDAISSRGGLVRHIPSGTYRINDAVIQDLKCAVNGEHASNLGPVMAKEMADAQGIPAFLVDPIVVDEMDEVARVSGYKGMQRESLFHALNHKSVGRKAAEKLGKTYDNVNLIIAHLGGGISVAAHKMGKAVDVFNTREEGAMCMDRGGSVPTSSVINMCFSGLEKNEVKKRLLRESGIFSYLQTRNFLEVEEMAADGNKEADLIYRAFVYQVAKDIGAMAAVLSFRVDAVVLTGGIVYSERFCEELCAYIEKIAPVLKFPGEEEMSALAEGALRVLHGEPAKIYQGGMA